MRTLIQAFRTKELRNKSLFVLGMIIIYRIGAYIPAPGVDASIVIQLLRVVIPRFEGLHKEGQSGEAKLTQYTRYLTIGLA